MNQLYICECTQGPKVDQKKLKSLKDHLKTNNVSYVLINDLCGICSSNNIDNLNLNKVGVNTVLGCKPKALNNLFQRTNIDKKEYKLEYHELNEFDINSLLPENFSINDTIEVNYTGDWKPWFPAIDYSACTSCQKCLNFCLFGVYKLSDEGSVVVENPDKCKDLCPACARTCPTNAIVFPKHHESPIDGGKAEFVVAGGGMLDEIQQSQDVYKLLANRRRASGISLLKTDQEKIAEKERKRFIKD